MAWRIDDDNRQIQSRTLGILIEIAYTEVSQVWPGLHPVARGIQPA